MTDEGPGPARSKIRAIQRAYAAGEGGYKTLARRFGVSPMVVKQYVRDPCYADPAFFNCRRKVRHGNREAAEAAIGSLVVSGKLRPGADCRAYACPTCGGWHVGNLWTEEGDHAPGV